MDMQASIVIRGRTAILTGMIFFVCAISLIPACSIIPKKTWYRSDYTQKELASDKLRCELQAQDRIMLTTNLYEFKACMEEHGWSLVEKKKK
jgi:hypothetical protein